MLFWSEITEEESFLYRGVAFSTGFCCTNFPQRCNEISRQIGALVDEGGCLRVAIDRWYQFNIEGLQILRTWICERKTHLELQNVNDNASQSYLPLKLNLSKLRGNKANSVVTRSGWEVIDDFTQDKVASSVLQHTLIGTTDFLPTISGNATNASLLIDLCLPSSLSSSNPAFTSTSPDFSLRAFSPNGQYSHSTWSTTVRHPRYSDHGPPSGAHFTGGCLDSERETGHSANMDNE